MIYPLDLKTLSLSQINLVSTLLTFVKRDKSLTAYIGNVSRVPALALLTTGESRQLKVKMLIDSLNTNGEHVGFTRSKSRKKYCSGEIMKN